MASVRVEGIMGHVLVAVEWRDGEVSGSPLLLKSIEQAARKQGTRLYEDPLTFAAAATSAVERYSDAPARVITDDLGDSMARGMTGISR